MLFRSLQITNDPTDQFETLLDVGVLATPKHDRKNDLVLLLQELAGPIDLEFQVMRADLRTQADLLILAMMRLGLVLPLLLLVLELPIVHDPADRWILERSDFHQIEVGIPRFGQGIRGADHTQLRAVLVNRPDWRGSDLIIDPLLTTFDCCNPPHETS